MQVRKGTRGSTPCITGPSVLGNKGRAEDQCIFPGLYTGLMEIRRLMACCLGIAAQLIFSTHTYTFGGKKYLQADGGPIGLRFTTAVARIRMAAWARAFGAKLNKNNIKPVIAMGYVDDLQYMLPLLKLGLKWGSVIEQLLYSSTQHVEDILNCITRTERSMNLYKEMMNTVVDDMEFTVEIGAEFQDEYLPTLDFKLKLEWC